MARIITFVDALREAIDEEMARDETVFVMGEDVVHGVFGVTRGLVDKYGRQRVRNTPIAEAVIAGAGLGAAIAGARPVVEIEFASMIYLAMDQIANQAAKARYMTGGQLRAPLTIRAPVAMGISAGAQHSDTPHALFAHTPGLKVAIPSSPRDAKGLLKAAIREDDPVLYFESLQLNTVKGEVPDEDEVIAFGQAAVVRAGGDVTIVALGTGVPAAVAAAEVLKEDGINAEIVDPRTVVPMDWDTILTSAEKTRRVVVVDDATPMCSVASEVAATVSEKLHGSLEAAVRRVTRGNAPIPYSPQLEQFLQITPTKVVEAARVALNLEAVA